MKMHHEIPDPKAPFFRTTHRSLCLLSILLLAVFPALAADNAFAGCANLFDRHFDGDRPGGTDPVIPLLTIIEGRVTACRASAVGQITIPDMDDGWPVTAIDPHAFTGCNSITTVVVPASVCLVADGAFSGCDALEVIEFKGDAPDLLSGSNLGGDPETTIVIFDSSRSGWPESGSRFGGLHAYTRDYPSDAYWQVRDNDDHTVTLVGMAYDGETELEIPETVFGKPVTALGEGAFAACSALEILSFPGDAPGVEGPLGLDGLRTVISVPAGSSGWDDDGTGFWEECLVVWRDYPESFWLVRPVAGGVAITGTARPATGRVDIPDTLGGQPVLSIATRIFANCTNLFSVGIPATVVDLDDSAFVDCPSITDIIFKGDAPTKGGRFLQLLPGTTVWVREDKAGWGVVPGTWREAPTQYWPVELLLDWEETDGGVAIAGVRVDDLAAVTIPAGIDGCKIVAINENAFASATNLARVAFEGEPPALAGDKDCTGLDPGKCVVYARLPATGWPGADRAPEPSEWQGCRLEFHTHPETWWATEDIGDGTLYITGLAPGAGPLEGEAILPGEIGGQKVSKIGSDAFASQTNLTAVRLHPNIREVGAEAFSGTAIGSILLTSNITYAVGSLVGCTNLTAVYIDAPAPPAWLEDIGADPATCIVYAPCDEPGWGELPARIADYTVMPASHPITTWTIRITSFTPTATIPGAWDMTIEATDGNHPVDMPVNRMADSIYVAPSVADIPSATTRAIINGGPVADASRLSFSVMNPDEHAPSSCFCIKLND